MDIRFLGHACFELTDGDTRVLVDPFLTGNPKAAAEASELEPTHIFLTHGHADHYGDIVDIAQAHRRAGGGDHGAGGRARASRALENVADPNIGGTVEFDGGWVRLDAGLAHRHLAERHGAHAGRARDQPGRQDRLPRGRHRRCSRTSGSPASATGSTRRSCASAATTRWTATTRRSPAEWIGAPTVIPCHYDTFPPIETDAQAFKADVEQRTGGRTTVEVLDPGGTLSL